MTFAQPLVLWGLIGPAIAAATLVVLGLLRRRRSWSRWPGIMRVVAVGTRVHPVGVARGSRRPWLLLLALTFALVALSGPRWGTIDEPVYQKSREVMIALDLSRSMLVQDVLPSRLDRSRLLVRSLLDGLRGERVGLIVFAGTAFVQVPMSTDYQILEEFLPELKPGYMPQGGSDYEGMLRAALGGFGSGSDTDRYLIVLSDGEAQDERWRQQLAELKQRQIQVIALGVGTSSGGFIPDPDTGAYVKDPRGAVVLSRLESATLQSLAAETGGAYRDASAWVDLAMLLQETIERGRQGGFTETRAARAIERFQWFLTPALILALLGVWREIPIRPRARQVRTQAKRVPESRPVSVPRPRGTGAASIAALAMTLSALLASPVDAAAEDTTPVPAIERLRTTITRLAASPSVAPAGWKAMAEQTIELGAELANARQPIEPGLVHDALAAVEAGEDAAPRAADWAKLREELRRLVEPPPEQKQEDKSEQDQDKQDGKPDPQEKEQSSDQPQDSQNPEQEQGMGESEPEKQEAQGGEGQPQQPPKPDKTRKFGGQQDSRPQSSTDSPELAAALARLEQVQEKDSPAILHQRLEAQTRREQRPGDAPENPHDW